MWLYIPNAPTSSASAREEAASISPSNWQFQVLERSAWSRGKALPAARWYQQWKRAIWLQRLFGAMPEPSMADHGAALWMASLAASRVSLTALPESGAVRKTNATSGRSPGASSSSPGRGSSSSKTSVGCCLRAVRNVSGETFSDWALRLRADCSARQKLVRRMSENDSSSSRWPTASSGDGSKGADRKRRDCNSPNSTLPTAVALWPTVLANEARIGFQDRSNPIKRGSQESLSTVAALWPTPQARDGKGANQQDLCDREGKTPPQNEVAVLWKTPRAIEGEKGGQWQRSGNSPPVETLTGQAFSLLDLTISTDGETHLRPRRTLNPLFVEWLMGWPPGWTLLAWTDLGCSATALCHWKARMRSALLSLGLPPEAPPAQLGLFG